MAGEEDWWEEGVLSGYLLPQTCSWLSVVKWGRVRNSPRASDSWLGCWVGRGQGGGDVGRLGIVQGGLAVGQRAQQGQP